MGKHYCKVCERKVTLGECIGRLEVDELVVELYDCPTPGCKNTLAVEGEPPV